MLLVRLDSRDSSASKFQLMNHPTTLGERLTARLRRAARFLSHTPLHPQWFSFNAKRRAFNEVRGLARGEVLDIGCGEGSLREALARHCYYTGLDSVATGQALYFASPDVYADAAWLPFRTGAFDTVALLDVLEHLPEPDRALGEIARTLAPGGRLLIHVPCMYPLHDEPYDYQRWTEHGLKLLLRRAGLQPLVIEPLGAPTETAALMLNIAVSASLMKMIRRFPPCLVFAVLLAPLVLASNIAGWLLGTASRGDSLMPVSYWLVAVPAVTARLNAAT